MRLRLELRIGIGLGLGYVLWGSFDVRDFVVLRFDREPPYCYRKLSVGRSSVTLMCRSHANSNSYPVTLEVNFNVDCVRHINSHFAYFLRCRLS